MAAHQAPPSLGFSRQEHWSGLPFPSPLLHAVCANFVESKVELHFPPLFLKKNGPNPNRLTSAVSVRRAVQPPRPVKQVSLSTSAAESDAEGTNFWDLPQKHQVNE